MGFETIWQMGETHPELRTDFLTLDQYLSSDFSSGEQSQQSDNITGDSSSSNGAGIKVECRLRVVRKQQEKALNFIWTRCG